MHQLNNVGTTTVLKVGHPSESACESPLSVKKRSNIESILATDETARYAFIESGCLSIDKKTSAENGDSNVISVITSVSAMPMWSLRSSLPLKIIQKFTMISINREIHNGTARYHLGSTFLASTKKRTEPKNEIMLNNSVKSPKESIVTDIDQSIQLIKTAAQ
ncbi:hypothetical protein RG963_13010 [Methanosarcina sp. Z-7115]|uniref:Uncharacterized protein n=1 Tax=Methanosarcina baikalica TaxID=3073890 RepID=A0ABU2D3V9_9EURY|nr:hypothetical protein [Methanosarcina sp. Z-7115]MDR7666680.1 hypothetical protein [Methanosarcina sp. Z-7115]